MPRRISILATVSVLVSALVLAISVLADDHRAASNSTGTVILASQTTRADIAPQTLTLAPAPKPDWLDDLIETIQAMGGCSQAAESIVKECPTPPCETWDDLDEYLDCTSNLIDQIQGPGPNLMPADAGQPGSDRTFTSLTECAEQCADWAQDAMDAIQSHDPPTSGDHAAAGYALDSIKRALPRYRELAGL